MATSKLQLPGGLRTVNGVPDIAKYWNNNDTPYTSTAQVLSEIPIGIRHTGLKVQVLTDEYWWPTTGGVTDGELVLYSPGGGGYYQTIEQDGTPLTQRATLNILNGLTASDVGGKTQIVFGGSLTANTDLVIGSGQRLRFLFDGIASNGNVIISHINPNAPTFSVSSQDDPLTANGGLTIGIVSVNMSWTDYTGTGATNIIIANIDGVTLNSLDGDDGDTTLLVASTNFQISSTYATFAGAIYDQDYSANYTNRSLPDKQYGDTHIGGQNVNSNVTSPTSGEDGYVISWNDSNQEYELIPPPSGGSGLTIGTTLISSGTNTRVLFNNAGVLGEYSISGTGNVAMTTSPVFTTPNLGTPSAITLTNGTGLPVAGITGLGTGVATFLATPSWTNFNSMITGTAPYRGLNGTYTYTGAVTDVITTTNSQTFSSSSLGTSVTPSIIAVNPTAASAGAQQYGPTRRTGGQGWKTQATAGSQPVWYDETVVPVQGVVSPTAIYQLRSYTNSVITNMQFDLNSDGGRFELLASGIRLRTSGAGVGGLSFSGSAPTGGRIDYGGAFAITSASSGSTLSIQAGALSGSSGTVSGVTIGNQTSVAMSSGTLSYNVLSIFDSPSAINNTGTYTGDFVAINFNPTITSLTGTTLYGLKIVPSQAVNAFGQSSATATIDIAGSSTTKASLRIRPGTAPSSPNDGDIYYIDTNDRLMFYKNATASEFLSASAVTTEVVVSDTTLTITYNGTTYKLLARV